MVFTYLMQIFSPIEVLALQQNLLRHLTTNMETLIDLVKQKGNKLCGSNNPLVKGHIKFEKVNFGFSKHQSILECSSFSIQPLQTTAIVGRSGIGKTTLWKLLLCIYKPLTGNISIDGKDVQKIDSEILTSFIGVVPQDIGIFNESILYNIAYSKPEASREEVQQAVSMAGLTSFISQQKKGYDTLLGEEGISLSGGEKQRIGLARALLKKPKILILDEPTSALDLEMRKEILKTIFALNKHCTIVIISHDLNILNKVDQVLMFENKQVTQVDRLSLTTQNLKNEGTLVR
jgi:ATP-binding cassette subfamily B protein